jgi:hypothetical protein
MDFNFIHAAVAAPSKVRFDIIFSRRAKPYINIATGQICDIIRACVGDKIAFQPVFCFVWMKLLPGLVLGPVEPPIRPPIPISLHSM